MERRAPLVPKVKLGHSNCVRHRVILPLVMAILGFLTIPWLGPKDTEPRATLVRKVKLGHTEPRALSAYVTPSNSYIGFPYHPLVRPKRHRTACAIGPKGKARTHGPHVPWGPYIQEVIYICWVQLSSLVRSKRHGTACAIGSKGEARTLGPRAPLGPYIQEYIDWLGSTILLG